MRVWEFFLHIDFDHRLDISVFHLDSSLHFLILGSLIKVSDIVLLITSENRFEDNVRSLKFRIF